MICNKKKRRASSCRVKFHSSLCWSAIFICNNHITSNLMSFSQSTCLPTHCWFLLWNSWGLYVKQHFKFTKLFEICCSNPLELNHFFSIQNKFCDIPSYMNHNRSWFFFILFTRAKVNYSNFVRVQKGAWSKYLHYFDTTQNRNLFTNHFIFIYWFNIQL